MSNIDIRVEGLSKSYRIAQSGGQGQRYKTLQEELLAVPRRLRAALRHAAANRRGGTETFWALDDVSFEVKQGEVLGIIGRNGAGKSTLLKILSRITEPTKGRVELYGRVGSLLEVGTGFHPELTGRENVYLSGAILGMRRTEIVRRFDEIVDFAGVEQFIDTPVKRYSSGMYMRLAFAVAAHLEPEILIVDEVLAVGDAEFQKKCLGKMGEVAQDGRTVLFVSHQLNAVESLCNTCLYLHNGTIVEHSHDTRAVIHQYLSSADKHSLSQWLNKDGKQFENSWFTPSRLYLSDHLGVPLEMPVGNTTEMWLAIEGEVKQVDPALTIGYALYSEEGQLLYWSYQTDRNPTEWPRLAPGHWVLKSRIPSRMLNEGRYRVELIGGLHFREWLFEPGKNGPAVDLNISGDLSDSPYWIARRPGLLALALPWTGEHLHD